MRKAYSCQPTAVTYMLRYIVAHKVGAGDGNTWILKQVILMWTCVYRNFICGGKIFRRNNDFKSKPHMSCTSSLSPPIPSSSPPPLAPLTSSLPTLFFTLLWKERVMLPTKFGFFCEVANLWLGMRYYIWRKQDCRIGLGLPDESLSTTVDCSTYNKIAFVLQLASWSFKHVIDML